jgi:hypothetical protein
MKYEKLLNEIASGMVSYTELSNKDKFRLESIMESKPHKGLKPLPFVYDKKFITEWLDYYGIQNYTINDDMSVDIDGSVLIDRRHIPRLDVKFRNVSNEFFINKCGLESMNNLPISCKCVTLTNNNINEISNVPLNCQYLNLNNNKITEIQNIEHLTELSTLEISHNKITKLYGLPSSIKRISLENNLLKNFKNFPKALIMRDDEKMYLIKGNPIVSLKGLDVDYNNIKVFLHLCKALPQINPKTYIDDVDKLIISTKELIKDKDELEMILAYLNFVSDDNAVEGSTNNDYKTMVHNAHYFQRFTKKPKSYGLVKHILSNRTY